MQHRKLMYSWLSEIIQHIPDKYIKGDKREGFGQYHIGTKLVKIPNFTFFKILHTNISGQYISFTSPFEKFGMVLLHKKDVIFILTFEN